MAYDLMLANDGAAMLYFPLFNYSDKSLNSLHIMHQHRQTRMGLSDGGAHCGAICDSGMPTFMLTHWTRDRKRGPTLPLEYIVMRQTKQTAEIYGMVDRGVLAPGYLADVKPHRLRPAHAPGPQDGLGPAPPTVDASSRRPTATA